VTKPRLQGGQARVVAVENGNGTWAVNDRRAGTTLASGLTKGLARRKARRANRRAHREQ
jgi:hypothetical protein